MTSPTKYAAYDHNSIYAVGDSPAAAIAQARKDARDDEAQFETAIVSPALAAHIEENGWNGHYDSFVVRGGEIFDTTKR